MVKKSPAFIKTGSRSEPVSSHTSGGSELFQVQGSLSIQDLKFHLEDWIADGQFQQHSDRTTEFRQHFAQKFLWFHDHKGYTECNATTTRQFMVHVAQGHKEPEGRWGNRHRTQATRPATIHRYYREARTFFAWAKRQGILCASPIDLIEPPKLRSEQVQPFTSDHIEALLRAARRSTHPRRDEAILLLLFDTGLRASELCGLRRRDIDLQERKITVVGKGRKRRSVYFGRTAGKALWQLLREQKRGEEEFIFISDRGFHAGEPLSRTGLLRLMKRLGKVARIQGVRCSPHTFRHTFAVEFLRNGGNVFTLKELLGHSGLQMTNRYVQLAQADLANQHRQFSPADRLIKGEPR